MRLVAGVDSSTQSTKVRIVDAVTGTLVREGRASHPDGTEVNPSHWWSALLEALASAGGIADVEAISIAGQQHGMVLLDSSGEVIRPALLWNDVRSAPQASLINEHFGDKEIAQRCGSKLVASFTASKVRWVYENEPDNAAKVAAIALPHDWLTWKLIGSGKISDLVTDRSDASGTGYFNPVTNEYDLEVIKLILGRTDVILPRVLAPNEKAGVTGASELPQGIAIAPGAGDNAGAALGLSLNRGDVVISLGTSGTAFASADTSSHDPEGYLAGFADCTGGYLPLVCTLNAARVFDAGSRILSVDHARFATLALSAKPGAGGLTLLPYFEGERTPNRPGARGMLTGLNLENSTPENIARAMIEGVILSMVDAVNQLKAHHIPVERILLIGGAAKNRAVAQIAAEQFGGRIQLPEPDEYVANGAARQAAWIALGGDQPPQWKLKIAEEVAHPESEAFTHYEALKNQTAGWDSP